MSDKKIWTRSEIVRLIEEYEQHRELWDSKCRNSRSKSRKNATLQYLAQEFSTTDYEISRKLHNLKTQFGQEIKKERERKKSSEKYVSKWRYFDMMKFMLCQDASASTDESTMDSTTDVVGHLTVDDEELTSKTPTPPSVKRIKKSASHNDDLARASKKTYITHDEYQIFGDYVASEIRNMHFLKYRGELKRRIQRLIIEMTEVDDNEYLKRDEEPVSSIEHGFKLSTSTVVDESESFFMTERIKREEVYPSSGVIKAEQGHGEKELLLSQY